MLESSPHSDLDCNQIYSFNQFLCTCRAFLETSYICGQLEGLNVVVELMGTIAIDTMDVSTVMVDGRFTGKECATVWEGVWDAAVGILRKGIGLMTPENKTRVHSHKTTCSLATLSPRASLSLVTSFVDDRHACRLMISPQRDWGSVEAWVSRPMVHVAVVTTRVVVRWDCAEAKRHNSKKKKSWLRAW